MREKCINALGQESYKYLYDNGGADALVPGLSGVHVTRPRSNSQSSHGSGGQAGTPGSPGHHYHQYGQPHPPAGYGLQHSSSDAGVQRAVEHSSLQHSYSEAALPDFDRLTQPASLNMYYPAVSAAPDHGVQAGPGSLPHYQHPHMTGNPGPYDMYLYNHALYPNMYHHPPYQGWTRMRMPGTMPRHNRPGDFPQTFSPGHVPVSSSEGSPVHGYGPAVPVSSAANTQNSYHVSTAYIPMDGTRPGYSTPPRHQPGLSPSHSQYPGVQFWAPEQQQSLQPPRGTLRSASTPAVAPVITPTREQIPIARADSFPIAADESYTQGETCAATQFTKG